MNGLRRVVLCLGISLLLMPAVFAAGLQAGEAMRFSDVHRSGDELTVTLHLPSFTIEQDDLGQYLQMQGALPTETPLPKIETMVAAPNGVGLSASLSVGSFIETGVSADSAVAVQPGVMVGEPVIFRGVRVFPLHIRPGKINADGTVEIADDVELSVSFSGSDNRAIVDDNEPLRVSAEVERYLRSVILNLDDIDYTVVAPLGRLLVVVENNATILQIIDPYVQWKRQQGYDVTVAHPTSTTSYSAIKSLIQTHYDANDPLPLDHVVLIGDHDGSIDMAAYSSITDHYYAQLQGGDILADVSIGRFSVRDYSQLARVVSKVTAYERDVDVNDTNWLTNSVLTAGSGSGTSAILTNQSIKWMLGTNNITSDTLWYTMPGYPGGIPQFIIDKVNDGAGFVNYRGYYGMSGWSSSDVDQFTNGSQMPFLVTITCGTGDFASQIECISEGFYRAGIGTEVSGAIAAVGTATTSTHTRFNNVVDAGIFESMLLQNQRTLGYALVNGKLRLYQAYVNTGDFGNVQNFSYWNNLMGDPALHVWVGPPQAATVTHDSNLPTGHNYLDVDVNLPGEWPEMVWATLATTDEVIDSRLIDAGGFVRLTWEPAATPAEMTLTVAGDNVAPYQATITTSQQQQYVHVLNTTVDDGVGGDDLANPGETVALDLQLRNSGTQSAPAQVANVSTNSPYLSIVGSTTFNVPALAAGGTTTIQDAVQIHVTEWAPDGARPQLTVTVGGSQASDALIEISAWTAHAAGLTPSFGGNGQLDPDETTTMVLSFANMGSVTGGGLSGTVITNNDNIIINDATATFSTVPPTGVSTNSTNPFTITATNGAWPGMRVDFTLVVTDGNGAVDSTFYTTWLSDPAGNGLTGPDPHGYWAVDDTDSGFLVSAGYNWTEIGITANRLPINDDSNEDDEAYVVNLPFPFGYYGETFNRITLSSNGTASFGSSPTLYTFRNWPVPNPNGPPAMLAPNWEDHITTGGGVYTWYDEGSGQFIMQWNVHVRENNAPQNFQVILFNPQVWPTVTGNGLVKFQYQTFSQESGYYYDNDYCTVGIESPDQQEGLQYLYWTDYADNADPLGSGSAILFTDDLSGGAADPTAVITPDEISHVYQDAIWSTPITITNTGTGPLIWTLQTIGDEFNGAARREALGLPLIPPARPALDQTYRMTPEDYDAFKLADNQHDFSVGNVILGSGGPDSFGYTWKDSDEPDGPTFQWINTYGDAFNSGDIVSGDYDDGYFAGQQLPFSFEFYGLNYNTVFINSNGFITFDANQIGSSTYSNTILPSTNAPRSGAPATVVAPFWDDLNPEEGGSVHYYDNGSELAVITWNSIYGYGLNGGPFTFQVVLHASGEIVTQYLQMGTQRLDECTIGIQNENGTIGLTTVANGPYVGNNLAVRFTVPQIWLDASPRSGIVQEGTNTEVTVELDGTDLPEDTYDGIVRILTNDIDNPQVDIPVTLYVGGGDVPPVVSDIPDQVILSGETFAPIQLDNYVEDQQFPDDQIQWSASGQVELIVDIVNRIATITTPSPDWTGSETITFTATNPNNAFASDDATFTVAGNALPVQLASNRFELVSLPIMPPSLAVEDVFDGIENLLIVQDEDGGEYVPSTGDNTIGDIDVTKAYRLITTQAQTVTFTGDQLDAMTEYVLTTGQWNWTGNPYLDSVPAEAAFDLISDQLVFVMNDEGQFWWPARMINTIGNIDPGDGYKLWVSEDVTLTYNWPTASSSIAGLQADKSSSGWITELPPAPNEPSPIGEPFVVHVQLHESVQDLSPKTIEILLNGEIAGAAGLLPDVPGEAVVVGWEGYGQSTNAQNAGRQIEVRVRNKTGQLIATEVPEALQLRKDTPYAEVLVRSVAIPDEFTVGAGYPNPFNPVVTIPFAVPTDGKVKIAVHNILGRQVHVETQTARAGRHVFVFNPGPGAPSGVYFVDVSFGGMSQRQKIVLLK